MCKQFCLHEQEIYIFLMFFFIKFRLITVIAIPFYICLKKNLTSIKNIYIFMRHIT